MHITPQEAKQIDEAIDLMTVLIAQTSSPIEREFVQDLRTKLITLTLIPVEGV